ncbi:hypothetical protein [Micrococcus terreus]|uniref:hypothetical protein n=1 Tax=Micrococcus terreus TaxID=574650 RepID=UPI0023F822A1|nr:hypothetical protein [Micrococcus terreus]
MSAASPTQQYLRLVRLSLRRHLVALASWLGGLLLLVAVTAPSYEATYPQLAERSILVDSLRANTATTLLYGPLPEPGTIGQLLAWETGTYVIVLGALMAILLAVTLIRRPEDEGTLELVRSTGVAPWIPVAAGLSVLIGQCLALGAGTGAILAIQAGQIVELSVSGAIAFGLLVLAVSLTFALATVVCCQLASEARTARSWGLLLLAAAFLLRAIPDATATLDADGRAPVTMAHWLSPLGWAQIVAPYTDDRLAPLLVFAAVALTLLALGLYLATRREYRSGLLSRRRGSRARMRVGSPLAFALRRGLSSWLGWAVTVVGLAALFAGMSTGVLDLINGSDATAQIVRQMLGAGAITSLYFRMTALLSGILVGIYAVGTVLRIRADEREGLLETELSLGRRRDEPLLADVATAALGSLALLAFAAAVSALTAQAQLGDAAQLDQTAGYLLLQWPAALCLVGLSALIVGAAPRLSWLMWALVAVSGTLAWLGGLFNLPDWVLNLVVFQHVPDLPTDPTFWPLAVLVGIGLIGTLVAVPLIRRRDIHRA